MKHRKLILEKSLADALVAYCESTLILPDDLLRVAIQQKPNEPFLLDARQLEGRNKTERMISILNYLWKSAPDAFEKAAQGLRGQERLWFAKNEKAISDTGRSNRPRRIGDSPWYVSINCPSSGMASRVERLMVKMGYSLRYATMVGRFIRDQKGGLYDAFVFESDKAV